MCVGGCSGWLGGKFLDDLVELVVDVDLDFGEFLT